MKQPVVEKGWSGVVAFSMLLGFFAFFVSAGILNYYYSTLGWDFGILIGVIAFGVSVAILKPRRQVINEAVHNRLAIIGIIKEREKMVDGKLIGREIVRLDVYPRYVDLQDDILIQKGSNKNIAIIGMAGSGKTELTYYIVSHMKEYHKIIFQYKNTDRYRELGYPVLFLKNYSPDVFRDKESFTQAWITAFSVENRGITASQIIPLIRNAVNKCSNWKEFKAELEQERAGMKEGITYSALSDILLKLDSVYSESQYNIQIPDDIVVDFEGLNKDTFVFFAEYILRELYEEIKSGTRNKTMIFVDEAHAFTKSGNTIIPELSAIIRSRGAFLFATQRASTIAGDIKGNAGTQYCFLQTEKEDLDEVKALSEPFHWATQRLYPYDFIDLAQHDSHKGIYIYRLINPEPLFKPVKEWKPQGVEKKESENSEDERSSNIDLPKEIIRLLSEPANQQDLAKRFTKEYGKDVNYWKMSLKTSLKKLHFEGEISGTATSYVKFVQDKPYEIRNSLVYHRIGDYSYHDWLVKVVADILYGQDIIPSIQPHGLALADILIEIPRKAYEIETGSKNGYKIEETQNRVKQYEKEGYNVCVIVPNDEVREKFRGFPNVMTALELFKEMKKK